MTEYIATKKDLDVTVVFFCFLYIPPSTLSTREALPIDQRLFE